MKISVSEILKSSVEKIDLDINVLDITLKDKSSNFEVIDPIILKGKLQNNERVIKFSGYIELKYKSICYRCFRRSYRTIFTTYCR